MFMILATKHKIINIYSHGQSLLRIIEQFNLHIGLLAHADSVANSFIHMHMYFSTP